MELRPYQSQGLNEIRANYGKGVKKVLLHLATGGGKTLIFCQVLKGAHEKKKRAMMVVRGKKLVDQASKRLERENVDHGVIMSGHWRNRPSLPIQICSIDTLYSRRKSTDLKDYDLIVIDEAHHATSPSYRWLAQNYPDAFFLPVTATPHVKGGLRHIADAVVYPITIRELIEQDFLVPPEYYIPSKPDLKQVHIDKKTGDYNLTELSEAMQHANLYGDMVTSYNKYAKDLSTLVFCVSVKHSKEVCETFKRAGLKAEHLDADVKDNERNSMIRRFESGETKIITNVGILTTGVDIPCVGCIILARPTKSYNLYIQILGRGTRPYPDKEKFIVLDHADCIVEHGLIENERECDLEGKPVTESKTPIVTCVKCYHTWDPVQQWADKNPELAKIQVGKDYICEGIIFNDDGSQEVCGTDMTPDALTSEGGGGPRKFISDDNYEMTILKSEEDFKEIAFNRTLDHLLDTAFMRSPPYKVGWVFHKISDNPMFGGEVAKNKSRKIKKLYAERELRH